MQSLAAHLMIESFTSTALTPISSWSSANANTKTLSSAKLDLNIPFSPFLISANSAESAQLRWMEKRNESHIAALRIMMRDTISQAVALRQYNFQAGSPEISHLMSSLLMAAMLKLAAMRTTAPVVLDKAEDMVTRLMRGLFGNLMTIAGSGIRPLSMVWQLFGLNPQYDVPVTDADWVWYENVVVVMMRSHAGCTFVELYPYTGWSLKQFHENLLKLLNKIIVRVIIKNENVTEIEESWVSEMLQFCKLRNIQLEHCRTIITIFKRMLTTDGADVPAIAGRLQENIASELEKQTKSFTRMIRYIDHLARGGARRLADDLHYGNVYTKRSAAFKDLKIAVAEACKEKDWEAVKANCQAVLDIQKRRIPWQVGNDTAKNNIETLYEQFLEEVLTGKHPKAETQAVVEVVKEELVEEGGFAAFKTSLAPKFISTIEKTLSAEDVCKMTKVPGSSMRVFIKALNPEFEWNDLGLQFKTVILSLLRDRSGRMESRPAARMLRLR
ncbi:hypothetical protein FOVG_17716 [Fusarium oxysporum f. sp. pisi HDV247]|uniref:Uncharacterized protein n=1 Tax=Fusarium oxysporum f. sp. pisi HDV247 TaxID=1080344 RepID=W9NE39_FUSOX|nr:hypothetical protein FOVG_17716 [Fusarium oxysporum f. sp. pisi HDV247]